MHSLVFPLVLCSLLLGTQARAVVPESGEYYDSVRSGLGYYIEVQGTTIVMIAFAYDQSEGKPMFYYAAGELTKSAPFYVASIDPPFQFLNEDAYQFVGTLYTFDVGPCITCSFLNWDTSEHAHAAGTVKLRFADRNRAYAGFELNDGTAIGSYISRYEFGRAGYVLRTRGFSYPTPKPTPDFRGQWVFTTKGADTKQSWRFNFTDVAGPEPVQPDNLFGQATNPDARMVVFSDPDQGAELKCYEYGCGLVQDGETKFLVKYWDYGMDSMTGYIGERMVQDDEDIYYRERPLVAGYRIANPEPTAPPASDTTSP